jgi:hypothetical protein
MLYLSFAVGFHVVDRANFSFGQEIGSSRRLYTNRRQAAHLLASFDGRIILKGV